ncbi:MAG: dienelactone hydrolase family protein [Ferribacterium limneticum]
MKPNAFALLLGFTQIFVMTAAAYADDSRECYPGHQPAISFVDYPVPDLIHGGRLTVKGKLTLPDRCRSHSRHPAPAVLILHGSAGVDSRGTFYAEALNEAGIATLEIDMWEARDVAGGSNRPPLPLVTYPDAFGGLDLLAARPEIDPERIGVLGFSWGGVISMATATENNQGAKYGYGVTRFKAHVAHYPLCYGYNNPYIPASEFGSQAGNPLTGAPILVQLGEQDNYDDSPAPCRQLKASLPPAEQATLEVVAYANAQHAWDRLQVPISITDPFAHLGRGGEVSLTPNVEQAYKARDRVVRFFRRTL